MNAIRLVGKFGLIWALAAACACLAGCGDSDEDTRTSEAEARPRVTPLASRDLEVSDQDQTLDVEGRIRVTVPGGLLRQAAKLRVGEVASPPAPPFDAVSAVAVYDVALGNLHEFDRDIRLEVPLRPEWLRADCPAWASVAPAYYDEQAKSWILLPCEVDPNANVLRFTTRHLSLVAINRVGETYAVTWDEETIRLVLLYNRSVVESETTGYVSGEDEDPNAPPRRSLLPPYIRGVLYAARNAIRNYAEHGFVPANASMWIYVQTAVNPTHYAVTGNLVIPLHEGNRLGLMQSVAHEMFHNVQSRQFSAPGVLVRNLLTGNWWLEASAEYAASRIAIADYPLMGKRNTAMPPNYLFSPLTYSPITEGRFPGHQYHGAHFLDFIVRQGQTLEATEGVAGSRGRYFRDLYDTVSSAPIAAEKYDPLIPLAAFIAGRHTGLTLDETYTRFAAHYLFSAASPMSVTDRAAIPAQAASQRLNLAPTAAERNLTFGLEGGHSAQLGVVTVEVPKDRSLPVSFRLLTEPRDGASAFVRLFAGARRDPQTTYGPLPEEYKPLSLQPVTLEAGPQDALCVLVVNNNTSPRLVAVAVRPEAQRGYWRLLRADHDPKKAPEMDYPNLKVKTWFDSEDGRCVGKVAHSLLEKEQWQTRNVRGEVIWQSPPARVPAGGTISMNATTRVEGDADETNISHCAQFRLSANMLIIKPHGALLQANGGRKTHSGTFTIELPDLGAHDKPVPLHPIRVEVAIPFGGSDTYEYRYEWVPAVIGAKNKPG